MLCLANSEPFYVGQPNESLGSYPYENKTSRAKT